VLLFGIGLYGVLSRRSAILIIMAIELMLNAVNINFVAAAAVHEGSGMFSNFDGHIIAIFIITIAAAEVGLALALVLRIFKNKSSVNVDEFDLMRW
jgi:NADH:ubiquinone oxidoreductase subunit K